MNIVHPFREGNGKSIRIWLDLILKNKLNKVMDWDKINKEDYLLAMERSPIKEVEIKTLIKSALNDKIKNCSYYYERYNLYLVEDL